MKTPKLKHKETASYWKYSLLAGLCALAIVLIGFAISGIAPFGEMSLLRNDATVQYGPLLMEAQRDVREGGSLLYSWSNGLGSNAYALNCYYLLNPFNLLVLLFPAEQITAAFSLVVICSTMLMAFAAAWYLQSHFKKSDLSTVIFAQLYTFSGFYFSYFYNTMWLLPVALAPFVLLGIEKIVNGEKPWMYLFALTASIFSNFYLSFMICIFSVLYFFICLFSRRINKKGEDEVSLLPTLLKFGGASLLAGGLCAMTLMPVMGAMGTAYTKSVFDVKTFFIFPLTDLFVAHLPGFVPPSMVLTKDTLPALTIGSLAILLVPLYAFTKKVPKNERIAHIVLTVLMWVSLEIPMVYYAWHGFSAPATLPYRFVFLYTFLLVKMAYTVWVEFDSLKKWMLCLSPVVVSIGYIIAGVSYHEVFDKLFLPGLIGTILVYIVLLLAKMAPKTKRAMTAVLLVLVIAQLSATTKGNYTGVEKKDYLPYQEAANEAVTQLDAKEKGEFYRMEFADNNWLKRSDINTDGPLEAGSAYGYNGVSVFSSLTDAQFAYFQYDMGNMGNIGNAFGYASQTPVYNTLFGIKYLVDNGGMTVGNTHYTQIGTAKGLTIQEVNEYRGMALLSNPGVQQWEFYNPNPFLSQSLLWESMTGVPGVFTQIPTQHVEMENCYVIDQDEIKNIQAHEAEHDHDAHHKHGIAQGDILDLLKTMKGYFAYGVENKEDAFSITYTLVPEKSQNVYLCLKAGLLNTVQINQDKKVTFLGKRIVDLGYCEAGVPIEIKVFSDKQPTLEARPNQVQDDAIYMMAVGLEEEAYEAGLAALQANGTVEFTAFSETEMQAHVSAKKDSVMTLAMPYDEGWTVTVDGEPVELLEHSSHWMMLEMPQGEHDVELHYFPQGLKEGLFVSGASLLILLLSVLVTKMRRERFAAEEAEEAKVSAQTEEEQQ